MPKTLKRSFTYRQKVYKLYNRCKQLKTLHDILFANEDPETEKKRREEEKIFKISSYFRTTSSGNTFQTLSVDEY